MLLQIICFINQIPYLIKFESFLKLPKNVDILNITPAERGYLREFIVEEAHRAEEAVNKL